ncbi:single-stranded DNA-binding protein [Salmonella enterica subsp. enterica]|uniref:Single-stranded DNA-binding protein n=1 Tax=Salmonella enterica subsp. enterica serovar Kintambo TaxID=1192730 RepID=A0A5W7S2Q6_SALET|nr:single-stranded DNA-binding protein [Salmonella enterica subsp. enterica serovar Kintambo]EBZ5774449.1 single-stranded DNA-binding protein [Salmonella enterica subsp. enterica serovar Redlands]ECE6153271.1 single-stranded DNA-binding protein [Salmonella enterica subsp. enterica]ELX7028075.1 single-stranded DNA-binding protein [Salmonella enterica]MLP08426.1 single-stranded DNA-binding protein [Salmonella enterica subsp. enterica serovar Kedougou]
MAQRGLNKICLIGFVGQDPEIRYTADKQPVAVFSVATGDSWKDKETGETKERTQWHRIVVYNKLAEIAAAHLKKGTQVYLEGRLQVRKWLDSIGAERQSTEVVVDINGMLQMLGKSEEGKKNHNESSDNKNAEE